MEHASPHGLLFVGLQLVVVVILGSIIARHHARWGVSARARSVHTVPLLLVAGFIVWYAVLRIQPGRRGTDPFGYTLGVFDGVSVAGVVGLVLVHLLLVRAGRGTAGAGQGKTL